MRADFLTMINESLPVDDYTEITTEEFDFNSILNLTQDIIHSVSAYPQKLVLPKILEGVKDLLVNFQTGDDELNRSLSVTKSYIEDLNRKDTIKRRWRRNTNAMLPIIAKRRYWRHKNKYKRAFQKWKESNSQKPFYDRLQKFAKAAFEERSRVYKEDVISLMKAVSSAFTHFCIGLDHDMSLHEHLIPVLELVTASLSDLTTCLETLNEDTTRSNDIYLNTLFLNAMLWTNLNLDVIGGEDEELAEDTK